MKKLHLDPRLLAAALATLLLALALPLEAHAQEQLDIPGPDGSVAFGTEIFALPNGNIVVTDPSYSIPDGPQNVGAVYLFNGATGERISMLTGSSANDFVGAAATDGANFLQPGITVLSTGHFVVKSAAWDNGAISNAGAATFINGTTGLSGVVSPANSLVGSSSGDSVGFRVTALTNGNYVVQSSGWDNGAVENVGAVTFGNGTSGITGEVSPANSLVGSARNDFVGQDGVMPLTNGNYVVRSTGWDNRGVLGRGRGAATFGDGTTGVVGVVSASNSLVGTSPEDRVGQVTPLPNGNYVVSTPFWDNGAIQNAGAATFADGTTGITGEISASNSLVGSTGSDFVGSRMTALTNGNYVVGSPAWSNGGMQSAGAVTFGDGTSGVTGEISASNSLVGSVNENIGSGGVAALTNGNYVVSSPAWGSGGVLSQARGAVTFADGTTGITGSVTSANSLVGTAPGDRIGTRITALSNGNYVVNSPEWDNGGIQNAGASTFGSGTTGITGEISAANSLVGSTQDDGVGYFTTALTNGNYVVGSPDWDNGTVQNVGASTFGDGTTGITGPVSAANSLIGSTAEDAVGGSFSHFLGPVDIGLVTPLANGNYVITTPLWDNGGTQDVGAVTFASGTTGITGEISATNSLVGSTAGDQVGFFRNAGDGRVPPNLVRALPNGDYAVGSPNYDNGEIVDAGAISYGNGNTGTVGAITAENSFVGTPANSRIGLIYVFDAVNRKLVIGRPTENVVTLLPVGAGPLLNISTRLRVQTGENVLIGGFIITGSEAKKVIIRAIGPSLGAQGVSDTLPDPTLELVDGGGVSLAFNDNWRDTQQAEVEASTIPPKRDEESAIVATLSPGNYTAVVRGNSDSTGIGVVEVYDLAQAAPSTLANISSRGRVETGENVMIGGFIVGGGTRVVVRAIGPSLTGTGVSDALQDPTLQLVDANGTEIRANDNWKSEQQAEIEAIGIQPSDEREATLIADLGAGNYTAVVRGQGGNTGVGLVEVYNLR